MKPDVFLTIDDNMHNAHRKNKQDGGVVCDDAAEICTASGDNEQIVPVHAHKHVANAKQVGKAGISAGGGSSRHKRASVSSVSSAETLGLSGTKRPSKMMLSDSSSRSGSNKSDSDEGERSVYFFMCLVYRYGACVRAEWMRQDCGQVVEVGQGQYPAAHVMMSSVGPAGFPGRRMNTAGKGLYPAAHVMIPSVGPAGLPGRRMSVCFFRQGRQMKCSKSTRMLFPWCGPREMSKHF